VADVTTENTAPESTRPETRYPAAVVRGITSMRLSPGDTVTLVNISGSGVLVEGRTRFVPGTRLTVIFDGPAAPSPVKGHVIRCQVSSIGGGGSLQYQSAIAFEARIDVPVDEPSKPAPANAVEPSTLPGPAASPETTRPPARNRW
jgi:hypothetical protein